MVPAGIRQLDARGGGLLELVVTLSLLAMLSLLAAPSLIGAWRAAALQAEAEELAGAVGHGRLLAISLNAPVCVAVGSDRVRFEAASAGRCSGVTAPGARPVRLAGASVVSAPDPDIVFTPLGAAVPGGTYTVTDRASGRTRRVVVAVSGRVTVR